MAIRKIITNRNAIVVKKLRMQKLKAGFPFMINMKELDTSQCYLEYPNGTIKLVTFVSSTRDINIIKELNTLDANNLRKRLDFSL